MSGARLLILRMKVAVAQGLRRPWYVTVPEHDHKASNKSKRLKWVRVNEDSIRGVGAALIPDYFPFVQHHCQGSSRQGER
jgi:hypothetical protein